MIKINLDKGKHEAFFICDSNHDLLDSNHVTLWLELQVAPDSNHTIPVSHCPFWFESPFTLDSNHVVSHISLLATVQFF